METEKEIEQLKKDLADAQSKITELRVAVARKEGTQAGAVWWLGGITALIAAWLGITSLWQIPSLVRATTSGQAEQEAKATADSAKKYAAELKAAAEAIPKYVRYDDALYISKMGGTHDGYIVIDPSDPLQVTKLFGPEQTQYPERSKFTIHQWKAQ